MFVTPEGQWVLPGSAAFLEALDDPDPDYDAEAFAVKNLGFIKFQMVAPAIVEIEFHPRNVQLPALLAVQQQIVGASATLIRIKYFTQSWHSEITSSAEQAIARLSELSTPKFSPPWQRKYVVEPRNYESLFSDEESPLRLMAQKWRMAFGHFDPSVISFAIKNKLLSRMIIIGVRPRAEEPIFRFIGDGHVNWLAPEHQIRAIGEQVKNMPDREYGGWVSEFYKNVARTGQPRYDYVSAAIERSAHTFTTRYERLLLPWRTPSDEVLVTLWSRGLSADADDSEARLPASSAARKSARSS